MNEVSTNALAYSLPAPAFDGPAALVLASCKNKLVYLGSDVQTLEVASIQAKTSLRDRQAYLFRQIKSHDAKAKAALVADMLACYGEKRDEDLRSTVTKYVQELREVPTWAVSLACQAIKIGQAPECSPAYRPTTIQVVLIARRYMAPTLQEIHEIGDVLRAKPYIKPLSPEEREVVKGKLQTFAEEFRAMTTAKRDHERDAARAQRHDERVARDTQSILASYGKRKLQYAGDFLLSPSLIKAIKGA